MLFYLTDSLICNQEDPHFKDIFRAVRNLSIAADEGRHLLLGDEGVLRWCRKIFGNDPIVGVIINILENYAMAVIPAEVKEYVRVINNNDPDGEREVTENDKSVYYRFFSRFYRSSSISETILIGENQRDADLYFLIGKWFAKYLDANIYLNYGHVGGGGKTTCDAIRDHQQRGIAFLAFTDTDQRYPDGPLGQTANNCLGLTYTPPFEHLKVINAHEAENIIPLHIIRNLPWNPGEDANNKHYYAIYDALPEENKDKLMYIDMKSGFSKHKTFKDDPEWVNYYHSLYDINRHVNSETFASRWSRCSAGDIIWAGMGNSLLERTIEWLRNDNDLSWEHFLPFQWDEWESIGQKVIDKCICRNPEASNF